jgi:hypothetical protein
MTIAKLHSHLSLNKSIPSSTKMKLNCLSFLSLCLAAQAIALSIPARTYMHDQTLARKIPNEQAIGSNFARGDEIEDGTQIAEGWKRSEDTAVVARGDEIEEGTQIAEGW